MICSKGKLVLSSTDKGKNWTKLGPYPVWVTRYRDEEHCNLNNVQTIQLSRLIGKGNDVQVIIHDWVASLEDISPHTIRIGDMVFHVAIPEWHKKLLPSIKKDVIDTIQEHFEAAARRIPAPLELSTKKQPSASHTFFSSITPKGPFLHQAKISISNTIKQLSKVFK